MNILKCLCCLCCLSCAGQPVSTTIGYGTRTNLYTDSQYNYNIRTLAINTGNLELNISDHGYNGFNCLSVGTKYHLNKTFDWFFVDVGLGFRLTEKDIRNKWLADSHFLADVSGSVGIEKGFDSFNCRLFYTLQHLSVPWNDDRGLNYDMLQFNIGIPF